MIKINSSFKCDKCPLYLPQILKIDKLTYGYLNVCVYCRLYGYVLIACNYTSTFVLLKTIEDINVEHSLITIVLESRV